MNQVWSLQDTSCTTTNGNETVCPRAQRRCRWNASGVPPFFFFLLRIKINARKKNSRSFFKIGLCRLNSNSFWHKNTRNKLVNSLEGNSPFKDSPSNQNCVLVFHISLSLLKYSSPECMYDYCVVHRSPRRKSCHKLLPFLEVTTVYESQFLLLLVLIF